MEQNMVTLRSESPIDLEATIQKFGDVNAPYKLDFEDPADTSTPGLVRFKLEGAFAVLGRKGGLEILFYDDNDFDFVFRLFQKGVVFQDGAAHGWRFEKESFGASYYRALFLKTLMQKRELEGKLELLMQAF